MKGTPQWLVAVFVVGSLAVGSALAETPSGGTNEWVAPARAAKKKNPIEISETSLAEGKAIWTKECASCHGEQGKGDGPGVKDLEKPPGDMASSKTQEQSDGALFWKITEGNKPMASYEKTLSEEGRWHVINYLRTLAPKPVK